jgi:hypothetical protein
MAPRIETVTQLRHGEGVEGTGERPRPLSDGLALSARGSRQEYGNERLVEICYCELLGSQPFNEWLDLPSLVVQRLLRIARSCERREEPLQMNVEPVRVRVYGRQ